MATESVNPRRTATILQFPAQHHRPLPTKGNGPHAAEIEAIAREAAQKFQREFGRTLPADLAQRIAQAIHDAPKIKG